MAPDPRVERQARALAAEGFKVHMLCWDRSADHETEETRSYATLTRVAIPAGFGQGMRNIPALIKWQFAVLKWLWKNRESYHFIHACDFDTVIPAVVMKAVAGKRIVYDVFDFYADSSKGAPWWLRAVLKWIDFRIMNLADAVIIVDETRKRQIAGARPKRLEVIYNSPDIPRSSFTSNKASSQPYSDEPLRIAYVGVLQLERGLIELLQLLKRRRDFFLDLAGFGADEKTILKAMTGMPNARFHGVVSYERALELASGAHVLIATYDPRIPNHRFSSANKLFEAMALGKPIIVARGTAMDELVERYGLGIVVEYGHIPDLEAALDDIQKWTAEERIRFSNHARKCYELYFSWTIMKQRLIALYREVGRVAGHE